MGLRRAAGFHIIDMLLGLRGADRETQFEVVDWFQGGLRQSDTDLGHYSQELECCGDGTMLAMQNSFFSILKKIVSMLKLERAEGPRLL